MPSKRVVDLVFLVDATGSMGDCIDSLKESIELFFRELTSENNPYAIRDWRAKVVGFRDVAYDGDEWFADNPFVRTADAINEQLNALTAKGGGDEPESLLDALLTLTDMGTCEAGEHENPFLWRQKRNAARAIVVFTDATYHPQAMLDQYVGCTYQDLARKIAQERIILEIVTPYCPADRLVPQEEFERCYEELAKIDRTEYVPLAAEDGTPISFQDVPANMKLFQNFMHQLARTISSTITPPEL